MEDLAKVRDEVVAIPALQARADACHAQLLRQQAEVEAQKAQYTKEQKDVERLEKEGFSAFVLRVAGRYEGRLEKEQQEEIEAKARYDKAVAQLYLLQRDASACTRRLGEAQRQKVRYQEALGRLHAQIMAQVDGAGAARYQKLEAERQTALGQMVEVRQAQQAAAEAAATGGAILQELDEAEGWATWDIWAGKGLFTHMAKYSHIDEAEGMFNTFAAQLHRLKEEVADVHGFGVPQLVLISGGTRTMDYWLDNIFTDLAVREQIQENLDEMRWLLGGIGELQQALAARQGELQMQLEANEKAREEILVNSAVQDA